MANNLEPLLIFGAALFVILKAKGVDFTKPLGTGTIPKPLPAIPPSPVNIPQTPTIGSSSFVIYYQNALNKLMNANLAVDGILGPKTRQAIMDFQTFIGTPATGVMNQDTEGALRYYDMNYSQWLTDIAGQRTGTEY